MTSFKLGFFFFKQLFRFSVHHFVNKDSGSHRPLSYLLRRMDEKWHAGWGWASCKHKACMSFPCCSREKGKGSVPHQTSSLLSPEPSLQGPIQHHILSSLDSWYTYIYTPADIADAYTQHLLFNLYPLHQIQPSTLTWDLSSFNPFLPLMPCTYVSELPSTASTVSHRLTHWSPQGFLAHFPLKAGAAHQLSSFSVCRQEDQHCWTSINLPPLQYLHSRPLPRVPQTTDRSAWCHWHYQLLFTVNEKN